MTEFYKKIDLNLIEHGQKLPLMEQFYSIQGEGFHAGKAAYFIRVGGCDIACHWCDSKMSWNTSLHPLVAIEDIVKKVLETQAKSVVITGGEPAMYPLEPLSNLLRKHNIANFMETSGAYAISGNWEWICVSPKRNKQPLQENLQRADELKVVVATEEDLSWAEKWKPMVSNRCKLFLQPEYTQFYTMAPKIVEYVQNNPEWNLSLQIHKYLNIP